MLKYIYNKTDHEHKDLTDNLTLDNEATSLDKIHMLTLPLIYLNKKLKF